MQHNTCTITDFLSPPLNSTVEAHNFVIFVLSFFLPPPFPFPFRPTNKNTLEKQIISCTPLHLLRNRHVTPRETKTAPRPVDSIRFLYNTLNISNFEVYNLPCIYRIYHKLPPCQKLTKKKTHTHTPTHIKFHEVFPTYIRSIGESCATCIPPPRRTGLGAHPPNVLANACTRASRQRLTNGRPHRFWVRTLSLNPAQCGLLEVDRSFAHGR